MSASKSQAAETTSDRELVITRVFDAPRELVFKMWTDPTHVVRWWGPRGCTTTIREMDVRPGGVWRYVMRTPDGTDWDNRLVYTEVVAPERLVYDHDADRDDDPHRMHVTTTFHERSGKTEVVMRTVFTSAKARDEAAEFARAGADSTFGRLGELLADLPIELVVTREIAAPRELVFRAFTEAEHLARWWGPKGYTMRSQKLDLRPGGIYHYHLRSPAGHEMWGKFVYVEIAAPERVVFISAFSDPESNTVRAEFDPNWPLEVMNTMTFSERAGKTTITLRGIPHNASAAERESFRGLHASMQAGFSATFEQLDAYLVTMG